MKTYKVNVDIPVVAGDTKKQLKRLLKANGFKLITKNKSAWTLTAFITSDMDVNEVNNSIQSLIQTIPLVNVHLSKEVSIKKKSATVIWMPCDRYFDQSLISYN